MKTIYGLLFLSLLTFNSFGQAALITSDSATLPDYRQEFLIIDGCDLTSVSVTQTPLPGTVFKKSDPPFVVDIIAEDLSGNKSSVDFEVTMFDTVRIGNQTWMQDNLRTTRYVDGTPIFTTTDSLEAAGTTTGMYCWYNNDSVLVEAVYGKLYNYYAINTDKICPAGWRVPTKEDWEEFISFVDPNVDFVKHEASTIAGGMLKDTLWWADENLATNDFGFNARPGGCRGWSGWYNSGGGFGYYAFIPNEGSVAFRWVTESLFMRDKISKYVNVSVRCIKK